MPACNQKQNCAHLLDEIGYPGPCRGLPIEIMDKVWIAEVAEHMAEGEISLAIGMLAYVRERYRSALQMPPYQSQRRDRHEAWGRQRKAKQARSKP